MKAEVLEAKTKVEQMADYEREMAAAAAAVEEAKKTLNSLTKAIGELAGFASPPTWIDQTMQCVLLLKSPPGKLAKGDGLTWNAAKIMMKDPQHFLIELIEFKDDIDNGKVPKANVDACRKTIAEPWFTFETISTKSIAAACIMSFVKNIVIYYDIVSGIDPKRGMSLAVANKELAAAMEALVGVEEAVGAAELAAWLMNEGVKPDDAAVTELVQQQEVIAIDS